ncbi:MAG: ABC transporter ATP-binding protein [Thermosphaera sp.]
MEAIMKLVDIKKYFPAGASILSLRRKYVRAVDGVSLDIYRGEVLALVGESGSGKSTIGKIIAGLLKPDEGKVFYRGEDIFKILNRKDVRHKIQAVFQNPDSSLNPRLTVFDAISEAIKAKNPKLEGSQLLGETVRLLKLMGLSEDHLIKYPGELSGGEKQRVAIARALAVEPEILVADEIVAAVDVSVRAHILNLLMDLKEMYKLTLIFITHDMGLVWAIADRIAIMYMGKIVEEGPVEETFKDPLHPYTKMLLTSSPSARLVGAYIDEKFKARGEPPSPIDPPKGCKFVTRCPLATKECWTQEPPLKPVSSNRKAACLKI